MADFNKILTPGNFEDGEINVVIEIPTGSNHKIEWDRKNACFMLDRVEPMVLFHRHLTRMVMSLMF